MGEMIKFGIKLAICIGIAAGLIAAFLIIVNLVTSLIPTGTFPYVFSEIFKFINFVFPLDLYVVFGVLGSLYAFKIAYWAQDKLIPLLDAAG